MASRYSMNDRPSWPRRAIVTAGEPYGNKGLHFGHVGGVFVPADFFARFLRDRLGRENVIFTSGTDCYGSPIMESYRKLKENEGYDKSIGEYVESNHSRQAATLNNYNISCDIYGGSGLEPAAQIHNEVTAEIIERLHEQGTISKRSTLQFYDAKAGTFLNGRQVIGRCPIQGCKSEKAYADECDLGHQFEPEELIAPKSQLTGEVPELRPVDNLYFDLPAYLDFMKTYTAKLAKNPQVRSVVSKTMEEWLLPAQLYIQNKFREAFDAVEDQLPEHTVLEPEGNKSSFTVTFPSWKERDDAHAVLANGGVRFRSGKALVPFRITGNIDWGVPVPEVDGVTDVTCWCWPESLWAPISYTRTVLARDAKAAGVTEGVAAQDAALMGEPAADSTQVPAPTYQHSSLDWRDWWCSDDAQIYQFIGQDNIYFYCIAQTAMWEALGWDLTQSTVSACYHLLYMGKKASSSSQTPPPPADDLLNHYTCEQMRAHWLSLGLSEKPVSFSPKAYDTRVTGKDKDGNDEKYCMGDCAINIDYQDTVDKATGEVTFTAAQKLAEVAVESARTAEFFGIDPKVALLSFSTKGSGKGGTVQLSHDATIEAQKLAPELAIDGEMQFDAAVSPVVGQLKFPGSPVAGHANTFIFPCIEAGNIGYKIAQRLGGFAAYGPILQGLNAPINDLSRGCDAEEVYQMSIITAALA